MRGLKRERTASVVISGHAFIQTLRRGHYELGLHARTRHVRLAAAFDELAEAIGALTTALGSAPNARRSVNATEPEAHCPAFRNSDRRRDARHPHPHCYRAVHHPQERRAVALLAVTGGLHATDSTQ